MRDHRRMDILKGIRAGLGVACTMLALVAIAMITFALAIWTVAATVLP